MKSKLENDINKLKDEYTKLILKSYKSKSEINRLMFIFHQKTSHKLIKDLII